MDLSEDILMLQSYWTFIFEMEKRSLSRGVDSKRQLGETNF